MEFVLDKDFKVSFEDWKQNRIDKEFLQIDKNGNKVRVYDLFSQFIISEKLNKLEKSERLFFYDKFYEGYNYGKGEGYVKALKEIDPLVSTNPAERENQVTELLRISTKSNSEYHLKLNSERILYRGYYNGLIQRCKMESTLFHNTTKENLLKQQNQLIPKISIKEVFDFFEILTKSTNKEGIPYLTEEQLIIFIQGTFIKRNPVKQKFNGAPDNKKDVRSVFYRFYKNSTIKESKQAGLRQKYYDILDKSFFGFNETDWKEFNKQNSNIKA
ncbi:hypothetical protein [Flagellimonas allohymeniacidonis]|uniref:Uncharacterized protein n=1 Tax=Flagellimonas allohymeniacidonis TaxID=2517819 RepID=A0A4Q8QJ38_9FLAO|nr:hypothetical protein [Allomuricauda hymeniacidonis]TAI48469.1 hypothetical protein EW142_01300 [Allomuricauda hymeniacidonis]